MFISIAVGCSVNDQHLSKKYAVEVTYTNGDKEKIMFIADRNPYMSQYGCLSAHGDYLRCGVRNFVITNVTEPTDGK